MKTYDVYHLGAFAERVQANSEREAIMLVAIYPGSRHEYTATPV